MEPPDDAKECLASGATTILCVVAIGDITWELAQLPVYTLWKAGSARAIIFAVLHCTGGDMLIAGATLIVSLVLLGTAEWPRVRFLSVVVATLMSGVGITAYIERLNTAQGVWTYSDLMPVLPGTGIGLAHLAQWLVIPILALAAARSAILAGHLDLPTMGITTSEGRAGNLARPDRRAL